MAQAGDGRGIPGRSGALKDSVGEGLGVDLAEAAAVSGAVAPREVGKPG